MVDDKPVTKASTRIVILGGGFGGLYTARHLEQYLRGRPGVEVVLVSRDNFFLMTPLLFDVCTGTLAMRGCTVPVRSAINSTRFIEAMVESVDIDRREVILHASDETKALKYDHLVLALGATTNLSLIPGSETAFTFKSLSDAAIVRNHVIEQLERADSETDAEKKRRRLTFVVIGGGLVGVELFGELTAFVHKILRSYPRIKESELRFVLLQHGPRILPEVEPQLSEYATTMLKKRPGVEVRTGSAVTGIEPGKVHIGDEEVVADTVVVAAGVATNPNVTSLPLKFDHHRLVVEPTMQSPERPEVWALGDCASVPDKDGKPYPCLAQHAIRQAKVLAQNIVATLDNRKTVPFRYDALGIMASIGGYKGIGKLLSLKMSGLSAWLARREYYLMTTPGWGRRLRIFADWAVALVTRPDTGRIDLDTEVARYVKGQNLSIAEPKTTPTSAPPSEGDKR